MVFIEKEATFNLSFFDYSLEIISETHKAKRVWKGLSKKISAQGKIKLYKGFLSEIEGIENTLYYYIQKALSFKMNIENDFTDAEILHLETTVKKVNREKHRMDAFVRFRHTQDKIYFATVEPDFDVLPLNAKHFKNRYADQKWLIYDLKRKYGIYYDMEKVETISLELSTDINNKSQASL